MAIQFLINGKAILARKLLIVIPYIICGLRFMVGWTFRRKHYIKEDSRWELWREKWRQGNGIFSIKNIPINFFFFYHTQSLTNIFIISLPLILICNNEAKEIYLIEIFCFIFWFLSWMLENVADFQLTKHRKNKELRGTTKCTGLWRYSRHPNYFFEWMIWISYTISTFFSIKENYQYLILAMLPISTYYFLVHFTGIPMAEESCLKNRGEDYKEYQDRTNRFFLWFPKKIKNKN